MHIVTFRVPSSQGPGWASIVRQAVPDGQVLMVAVPTEFLVSPGQTLSVGLSVEHMPAQKPGDGLDDARGVVTMQPTYDYSLVPSDRPLYAIMEDIVSHGREYPTHGPGCSCMDQYSRELKQHISRAIPPDNGEREDVHWRVDARQRIAYVLGMVERWV